MNYKSLLSLLLVVSIGISSYGQLKPKNDTTYYMVIRVPLMDWNRSVDSVSRFSIPSIGVRMYTDEQVTYQQILIRQFNKYISNSKLDTVITKK